MNTTLRAQAETIVTASIHAVLPDEAVRRALQTFQPRGGRVVLVAAGKAAWQMAHAALAELGRVDVGGGGTIAYICALYGMEVIDSGVAVLSMHAPLEIINKADLYEAMRAYRAFMLEA